MNVRTVNIIMLLLGNLACSLPQLRADNGALAYAHPIAPIVVDGDPSDWPNGLPVHEIQRTYYGQTPEDAADFSGQFRLGYNLGQHTLYVLVEITDESYINDPKAEWRAQDGHLFYIDRKHSIRGSGPALYIVNGDQKELNPVENTWDPELLKASWDNVQVKSTNNGKTVIYEWAIELGDDLYPGKTLGMDHLIIDKDASDPDGEFTYLTWGPGTGKSGTSGLLGDVILVEKPEAMGRVKGKIQWQDKSIETKLPRRIQISNRNQADFWVQVELDSLGQYDLQLPAGSYSLSMPLGFYGDDNLKVNLDKTVQFTVLPGQTTEAKLWSLEILSQPDIIPEKGVLLSSPEKLNEQIDQFMQTSMAYYGVPGASVAVIKDGKLAHYNTYGVKNAYTMQKLDENTLFEAASITKTMFAFAVNRMVERGEIELDKPLHEYLPFPEITHDERYKLITARHVLTHQTGFPNWRWMNDDGKIDLKFTPGTSYGYSGEGFEYLGRVVAHITGKDLNTVLREETLEPMGLEHTFFSYTPELQKMASHGHFDHAVTSHSIPREPGMAHSMYTEARTFADYMLSLMNQKGLGKKAYEAMLTPQVAIPDDEPIPGVTQSFGLGFHLMETPLGKVYGHGGNNGDFKCLFEIYQDQNCGFVIFTNSNMGDELHDALRDFLIVGKM
ncbi:MAG: serine hydrolase [Bacteroidota bacterium]